MVDFGYDVSDYCDVDPIFGSPADFDQLVDNAHAHGIRVVLDWVANHTSQDHPWFLQSRSGRDNPKRDW
jgi:alpha-glucosidase